MPIRAILLGTALSAAAHDLYPIRPVQATLRIEPDRIVVDLRADSIIWIEEVTGLHPMPPRDWPRETLAKVEGYVNSHFRLAAGGKDLPGRLVDARYRQLPWEVNEEGTFFLRLVYPGAPQDETLSVTANFYEDYRKELESELGGRPIPFADAYRTIVAASGLRRELTPASPSFTAPVQELRRGAFAMALESLSLGTSTTLGLAAGFPALLAIALCLGGAHPDRAAFIVVAAAAALGFLAGGLLDPPAWLLWSATLAAALAAGRWRRASLAGVTAAFCLGLAWCGAAKPLLPHSAAALASALGGALAAGAGLLFALRLGVREEWRRMLELSESRVDELFDRRVRLTATVLAMIGAYGLWRSLPR
jgi:hypothetical protein